MKPKFKNGDKVIVTKSSNGMLGQVGTVYFVQVPRIFPDNEEKQYYYVLLPDYMIHHVRIIEQNIAPYSKELEEKFKALRPKLKRKFTVWWTKVSDKLPKANQTVFVLTKNGKVSTNRMEYPHNSKGKQLSDIPEWKGSSAFTDSFVAWMPIPPFDEIIETHGNK